MKRLFLLTAMAASLSAAAQVWDKTFPQSDQASVEKVSFKNRYDITVVADMYLPKNLNRSQEHAAIVIGHPFGGVKEQSSGPSNWPNADSSPSLSIFRMAERAAVRRVIWHRPKLMWMISAPP